MDTLFYECHVLMNVRTVIHVLKVASIHEFRCPCTLLSLAKFLCMLSYYHRSLLHATQVLQPLHCAHDQRPSSAFIEWMPDLLGIFNHLVHLGFLLLAFPPTPRSLAGAPHGCV